VIFAGVPASYLAGVEPTGQPGRPYQPFVSADHGNWLGLFGGFLAVLVAVSVAASLQAYANA
jgi:hypothetical protein